MKNWKGVIGLVGLLLVSVAYGEDRGGKTGVEPDSAGTPEQARSELSERGIQYTQSSFFDRVEKGDLFAVQLFMDAGMAIHARTDQGETALMVAAGEGDVEMVQLLVDNGTDINAQTGSGRTALMVAAGEGHIEVGRFLVDNGADINVEDKNGWTALDLASWGGDPKIGIAHVEVVRSLVERWVAKAGANARTEDGKTALHWAVLSGDLAMVRFLVANGAEINAQTKYGWTVLMQAAQKGDLAMVRFLVSAGAEINARAKYGWTVLMMVARVGDLAMVRFLVSKRCRDQRPNRYRRNGLDTNRPQWRRDGSLFGGRGCRCQRPN